jgi:REP element-mobilizing transposase RayT
MKQFKSRKQNRLKGYDCSTNGYYYITICTQNREYIFGDIANNEMTLNQYGDIARNSWLDLPSHHENIGLDQFIIMPNHIHGIIIINNPVGGGPARSSDNHTNNLSVIIGPYKSTATKQINRINDNTSKWQKSFHDHIIRIDESLNNIRNYITNNPKAWELDKNNINYLEVQAGLNPTG